MCPDGIFVKILEENVHASTKLRQELLDTESGEGAIESTANRLASLSAMSGAFET
jgi:hypothetical protein